MKLTGPLVDKLMSEVVEVLGATKAFLHARTAEANINAMHTDRDKAYLSEQIRKKDSYIAQLQSRLDSVNGRNAPPSPRRKRDDRRGDNAGPNEPQQEQEQEQTTRPAFNGIRGLQGVKVADGEQLHAATG